MDSKLYTKAHYIEDLNGEKYISLDIPCGSEDEWDYLYSKVTAGLYLPRDREGNGYFFENSEDVWIEVRDLKPTDKHIVTLDEKETILKCLELKETEQAREIEEARKMWQVYQ